ncbi:MAG TPA: hypothetical protein VN228_07475 [Pyrinomonadaceae bacterium]|nr:hypothetical protein [Pyrinomonadaceae bacterium]
MLYLVTVRAQHDALFDFKFDFVGGQAAADHVGDVEIFLPLMMMKL